MTGDDARADADANANGWSPNSKSQLLGGVGRCGVCSRLMADGGVPVNAWCLQKDAAGRWTVSTAGKPAEVGR